MKVFISYATEDYDKVRQIYDELKAAGVEPWFDRENLLPGQNWKHEIKKAIRESDYCLILLSSHAFTRRGFVHAEQRYALEVFEEFPEGEVFAVPARLDDCETPSGLQGLHWVDLFPTREQGMKQLLRLFAPESSGPTDVEPDVMGEPTHIAFFEELFDQFHRNRVVMLTGQAGRDSVPMSPTLKECAQSHYGPRNFIHNVPPITTDGGDYFSDLERQCGADEPVGSDVGFMQAVESHLTGNNPVLLFVTGFERSGEERLQDLAGALRSLDERRGDLLRILISGGEKLTTLYYVGALSYLNSAKIMEWPELTAGDVCALCEKSCANSETALKLLEISGGNPLLLEMAVRHCAANGGFDAAGCVETLKDAPAVARMFAQFDKDDATRKMICGFLKKDEPGPFKRYMRDAVLRHLYWENLLKKSDDGKRLAWRCGLMVEMGREILECA